MITNLEIVQNRGKFFVLIVARLMRKHSIVLFVEKTNKASHQIESR
jgi:hypothetical protein